MTTDSKCRPSAQQDASSQQDKPPSGCSAASTGTSLIIQLPTTSYQQLSQSDLTSGACSRSLGAAAAVRRPALNQNYRDPRHRRSTNLTGAVLPSTNPHHHRISNHRYQQSAAHAAIDHHLLASSALVNEPGEPNNESSSAREGSSPAGTPPPNYHEIPGIVPSYHGRTSGPPPAYEDVINPNASPPSYQSLFGQVREARKSSNGLVDLLRQLFLVLIGTLGCTMIIGFLLLIPITMIFIGLFYMNECRAENIPSFLVIGGFVWIMKNILNCYNQFKKDSTTINRPPAPRRPPIAARANPLTSLSEPSSAVVITPNDLDGQQTNIISQPSGGLAISATSSTTHTTTTTIATTTTSTTMSSTRSSAANHLVRHPPMIGITSYKCESLLNYFLVVWFLAGCIVVYRIYEPDYENPLSASYCNRTVYMYAFWLMTSAFIIMAVILSCLCCLMASSLMSCSSGR